MYSPSRRAVALLATAATLGAGSLATAAQASDATPAAPRVSATQRGLLDVLTPVLALITPASTPAQVQTAIATLPAADLGGLLDAASPDQVTALLGALAPAQLTTAVSSLVSTGGLGDVLGTLTPIQIGDLLAPLTGNALGGALDALDFDVLGDALATLDPTQLTSVVSALTPTQITGLLGTPSAVPDVVAGLLGSANGLTAGTPTAASVNALLTQLQALLGDGLPDVAGIDALLSTVDSLLAVPGLDTSLLTSLLGTANTALGSSTPGTPATTALQHLTRTLSGLTGSTYKPGGTSSSTAYHATVTTIKVAKNRRSAKVTISCPASAPKGCLVTVKGSVAGRRAFTSKQIAIVHKAKKTMTMKLTKTVAKRLSTKGGSLKVTARTALSSLSSTSKTVRVARRH